MSLNRILEISESVEVNDHRFVGQVVSRNQRLATSEVLTVVPFSFVMQPMKFLLYSQNRGLLNSLRIPDKALEQYLNFSETGWSHFVKYQGDMTAAQIGGCTWSPSSSGKTLVLTDLPAIASNAYIVRVGDYCQVGRYSYIATEDVRRGTLAQVSIPVHRNLIDNLAGAVQVVIGQHGLTVSMGGNQYTGITFPVILRDYPTYSLTPITNDSFINWSGDFAAFESVL